MASDLTTVVLFALSREAGPFVRSLGLAWTVAP